MAQLQLIEEGKYDHRFFMDDSKNLNDMLFDQKNGYKSGV